jgi:Uma2 family endonuclease
MAEKQTSVDAYFRMRESNRPMELIFGSVHEPPSPFGEHQTRVFRLAKLLDAHVEPRGLGTVFIAPLDVVLDQDNGLVVQPDVMYISAERSAIVRERVFGAPDLVIEVSSPSTEHRDRTIKVSWYMRYGVRECWVVDARAQRVTIHNSRSRESRTFSQLERLQSTVLPDWNATVEDCLA